KEVLKKFEKILLHLSATPNLGDYLNKTEEFIDNVANKTGLYKELIHLWLDEKVELKENDLKKIDDYLDIIKNKENCVNLLTAIVKGYIYIKFDLSDKFTNDFIKDIHNNSIENSIEFATTDGEDERVIRISIEIRNNEPIGIRDILFIMSYIHVEKEYDSILKNLMVYKVG
ncbi:MAG: hypothetical protein ACI3T9_07355, partial [Romboutsia timonensis]